MILSVPDIAALCVAALLAGVIDAIAGGGGLLTVPALLSAGLPPHLVLGTNKGQSVFGSGAALVRFAKARLIRGPRAALMFPLGFVGSLCGAAAVLLVNPAVLRPLVIALLMLAAVLVLTGMGNKSNPASRPRARQGASGAVAAGLIALGMGAYDGFFGPGTGTFLIAAFVAVLGESLTAASAAAKVVNFASNLAAVILFAARGAVLWRIALPMALAQFAGGWIGAHFTIKGGDVLVRRAMILVVAALILKLGHDLRL